MEIYFSFLTVANGRVFGLDQQTLIGIGIQLFNAGLLAVALSVILYAPVQKALKGRSDHISSRLDHIASEWETVRQLKADYEEKLHHIERERTHLLEAARKNALENSQMMLDTAKKEAFALRVQAEQDVLQEKARASDEVRLQILSVATLLASKFITNNIDADTQERLYQQTLAELEEITWLS